MSFDRQKVIDTALNEVGYLEKASNSQLDSKTANAGYGNWTKYARDLDKVTGFYNGKKNGYAYCDIFVDWCFVTTYGVENAKMLLCQPDNSAGAGCTYSAQYYKNKGQFHKKNPQPGDQIFFGTAQECTHTGIVTAVDKTKVYTAEGNTSGASGVIANGGGVCEKSYPLTYSSIHGYGRPNYDDDYTAPSNTSSSTIKETTNTNGSSGGLIDTVVEVQYWLNNAFKSGLTADGLYGTRTKEALIKALQTALGVESDGIYGPITNAAVKVLRIGHTGTLVKVLQAFLVCNGYKAAYVDGDFGTGTYNSLVAYQRRMGLRLVDGEAGRETFSSLCK